MKIKNYALLIGVTLFIGAVVFAISIYWSHIRSNKNYSNSGQIFGQQIESISEFDQFSSNQQQMKTQLLELNSQVKDLSTQVSSLSSRVAKLEEEGVTKITSTGTKTISEPNEYSLFLGSGSTYNKTWTNIDTTTIRIDPADYQGNKKIYFEASLSIIGGEIHARLIDKSDGSLIYNSELMNNTQGARWVVSQPIYLRPTSTEYVVQIRSSSGEGATLNGARIKIVTQ